MGTWLFACDLRNLSGRHDYMPLWDELNRLGGNRVQNSVWLLNLSDASTATTLISYFEKYCHKEDRLWISELTKYNDRRNAMPGTGEWLIQNAPIY